MCSTFRSVLQMGHHQTGTRRSKRPEKEKCVFVCKIKPFRLKFECNMQDKGYFTACNSINLCVPFPPLFVFTILAHINAEISNKYASRSGLEMYHTVCTTVTHSQHGTHDVWHIRSTLFYDGLVTKALLTPSTLSTKIFKTSAAHSVVRDEDI